MAFSLSFRNIGHFFATGAKYLATGVADIVKVANKAQVVEPEVALLVGALAGPAGVKISDLAFHVLGATAAALQTTGTDAAAVAASGGLSITLDAQVINDIRAAAFTIEAVLKAVGGAKPTA